MAEAVAVAFSMAWPQDAVQDLPDEERALGMLAAFRGGLYRCFTRRPDALFEHTFRFFKQVLGWTRPNLRDPAAADRWTWLILASYVQLRLARHLAADIRLPWQRPCPPGRLTPARVRRGFRNIRQTLPCPASAPKPGKPGPGRPPGSKNRHPATRHDVGKTIKRDKPDKKTRRQKAKITSSGPGREPGRRGRSGIHNRAEGPALHGSPGATARARVLGHTGSMNIEVTRILGDGSIRRARIEPEERPDAARWRELVSRANLNLPPPYRPDPGRPVYQVSDGEHSIQVAERGLVGPLRDLVAAVLAEGAQAD